ncbi:hypothetical protein KY326_02115, partial [Candidatus Woesearchaeota archaeon]|nr:hypothetical protein [Candidatus Woesearchaeota archaeon]
CCQGQFIGVWDKYQSGDDRLEFGLLGTEPAIIYPWRIKFKTYGPEGEKLSYRISRREGLRVCQSDVNITLQTLRSSIHRIKVFVGDEAVERAITLFAIHNEDYLNILGQYGKSPKLILPEDDGRFIGYG